MKQLTRYFSLGLFTAGIIMLIGIYFSDSNKMDELSAEEMVPLLEKEGYHVLSNNEYISMTVNSSENNNEEEEDNNSEVTEADEEENKEDVSEDNGDKEEEEETSKEDDSEQSSDEKTSYALNIESGMPTSTISSQLEENGIIDDASEFTEYMEEHDYTLKVKAREVEVYSDMSFYELAEALTTY
ncbi:endolytic transglycosylase MltG [Oceanobacillus salinisoli]|uniref:endolytic transglycosylase MltG n=1 Tax=Oceanobacillus salinisoli TaxID=2678611 RepID=UPI001E3E89E5|nr:endolytic transglycosylase MltG [Oceanobacillus salinisoli]